MWELLLLLVLLLLPFAFGLFVIYIVFTGYYYIFFLAFWNAVIFSFLFFAFFPILFCCLVIRRYLSLFRAFSPQRSYAVTRWSRRNEGLFIYVYVLVVVLAVASLPRRCRSTRCHFSMSALSLRAPPSPSVSASVCVRLCVFLYWSAKKFWASDAAKAPQRQAQALTPLHTLTRAHVQTLSLFLSGGKSSAQVAALPSRP